jgi:uncharacterized protein YecE (DUF72 family)
MTFVNLCAIRGNAKGCSPQMRRGKTMEKTRIGCQGWLYHDWTTKAGSASVFYPTGTRSDEMLRLYSRAFTSVEVDSTFYAIPSTQTLHNWARRTPDSFTFSPKLLQEITHTEGLRGEESKRLLEDFCERIGILGEKLGVALIQLPPQFVNMPENFRALREFLPLLPRDFRWSIEFRSYGWIEEGTADLLREYKVAPALVEGQWIKRESLFEMAERVNAPFAYIRWMGARDLTRFREVQRPQDANLKLWAEKIADLRERDVEAFAYFSNYYEGLATASALRLQELLGGKHFDPQELESQPSLF